MLVEMIETSPDNWTWKSTDGLEWTTMIASNTKPVEAQSLELQADGKAITKTLIKLKEAGFTADEIIEFQKANLLYTQE